MKYPICILVFTLVGFSSCKKEAEEVIDCLFVSADFDVTHTVEESTKTATFTVDYDGEHTLRNSIEYDFGDGSTQTISGTTATHVYSSAGSYTVKVKPTVEHAGSYCTPELTENVTIN